MIVRHATTKANLDAILAEGLRPEMSRCKGKVTKDGRVLTVWLHSPYRTAWALLHMFRRHQAAPDQVVVLECSVPRRWLERTRSQGLWQTPKRIPPSRILRVIEGSEFTKSPIEENC